MDRLTDRSNPSTIDAERNPPTLSARVINLFTAGRSRNRPVHCVAVLAIILLGLASRRYQSPLSGFFGKYPGDALWAAMVFLGWGALFPKWSIGRLAAIASASCACVELCKLFREPGMIAVRSTVLGHLVFGSVFSAANLVAYAIGIVVAIVIDSAIAPAIHSPLQSQTVGASSESDPTDPAADVGTPRFTARAPAVQADDDRGS